MLECLLSILLSGQQSKVFKEFLFEIFAFDFLEIKISFQAVIQLLLVTEQLVRNLNDRVVVPETIRI